MDSTVSPLQQKKSQKYILSPIALEAKKMYNTVSLWQEVKEMIRQGAVMGIISNHGGDVSHRRAWTHRLWPIARHSTCLVVRKVFADAVCLCARLSDHAEATSRSQSEKIRGELRRTDIAMSLLTVGCLGVIGGFVEVFLLQYTSRGIS